MNITIVEETNLEAWDKNYKDLSASLFASVPWLESAREPNRTPRYFRFVFEGKTAGIASGLSLEPPHPRLKKIFRKLFFFAGPAFALDNHELKKECIAKLLEFASTNKYTHLEIKSYDYPHQLDFDGLKFSKVERQEFILDLSPEWPEIHKNMRGSIIRQKNKAIKYGLSFHESSSHELIEALVPLLEHTKRRRLEKGYKDYSYYYMPYVNKDFLHKLIQNKVGRMVYVKASNEVVCVTFLVIYDRRAYYLLNGTKKEAYNLQAPTFLWFNTIKKLKEEGFKYLNLGRVPDDPSGSNLIFYKTSLGARKHICVEGRTPHLNGHIFHLLNTIYRKVPDTKIGKIVSNYFSGRET